MPGTITGVDRTGRFSSSHPGQTTPVADVSDERIKRRPVLGGLLNEYERAA
jgi:hypothetical protein